MGGRGVLLFFPSPIGASILRYREPTMEKAECFQQQKMMVEDFRFGMVETMKRGLEFGQFGF